MYRALPVSLNRVVPGSLSLRLPRVNPVDQGYGRAGTLEEGLQWVRFAGASDPPAPLWSRAFELLDCCEVDPEQSS